ncbi:MAG: S1 RNA-binding domain-containing protein [Planctomycetota bacterium]|nr:MAG: S1 RNA-binding domain-containing protein [Planctomycetota bacterium]REJ95353.1 MAG: S1 RNA-binding domain-containing protein [Planctomycetota bacterium]REK24216.1 MAG: S1 RNA-binding domain-containing protein [Planctomycetota bacterium]REK28852.1 MAG: S1 RNA-binding domain-containing protein [Planctomycetota bacterium]
MKKEMLINALQPEESRIAIVEDGVLEELYVERTSQGNLVGNIYKGRVVNIEPSIQAVFVDFGVGRNGFLHVSDVEHQYFKHLVGEQDADGNGSGSSSGGRGNRGRRVNERSARNKPPIQEIFQRGSEVLVQVIKEGIGTKGPTLSTYISIPGRYLVLMPGLQRVGVSRKISDDTARRRIRQALRDINPPEGLGFIVRTAGIDRTKQELQRDLHYLLRLWKTIVKRIKNQSSPVDIYEESDMITRTIRDIYTGDIESVWIDEPQAYERAKDFMRVVMPKHADCVKRYDGKEPIFHMYHIEEEIDRIQNRHLPLEGGGSIVIDQTEALVAIDVNSGSFRVENDAEETAYQVNLKAAEEIARQVRLRDLGGVIVNDFIDMREERHRRGVERKLRACVERDRARSKVLRISPFGIIEMTRQRIRPSLRRSVYEDCPCCHGVGQVKTAESMGIDVMRTLMTRASRPDVRRVDIEVHQRVADYLINHKRRKMTELEEGYDVVVNVQVGFNVQPEHLAVRCFNDIGAEVAETAAEHSNSRR